jgi:hypothetical protein
MDYVYICRPGENEELRYSIRSVVKNAIYDNIWVVGEKPDWYVGNFVHVPNTGTKFTNIYNCFSAITDVGAISDNFVLIEDDMFLVKPIGIMPVYCGGLMSDRITELKNISPNAKYINILQLTYKYIIKFLKVKEPINYEIHFPLVMNKQNLSKSLRHSLFQKSIYGNKFKIGGQETLDSKVHTQGRWLEKSYDFRNGNSPIISTDEDHSFKVVYDEVLKDMFPNPSRYER